MNNPYFDLHVHPTIKPFGHACKKLLKTYKEITPVHLSVDFLKSKHPEILSGFYNAKDESSIWNDKKPNRILNPLFGELAFAKYSQSNLSTAIEGNSRVLCLSLYPIEKEFLTKSIDQKITGVPIFKNMVTGISSERIKYIQGNYYNYFTDVEAEYEFLKTTASAPSSCGKNLVLVSSYNEIEKALAADPNTIVAFISIEGANVFYPSTGIVKDQIGKVLENIDKAKNWQHPPFMVSLAHHFYNGFVSHEKSLVNMVKRLGKIDQSKGCNTRLSNIPGMGYYTREGLQVIEKLLDEKTGQRINIDVKHMDYRARKEYYNYLAKNYNNSVPVIFSHAAVGEQVPEKWFNTWSLNLNDDDIKAVWQTHGIIGLELDQRILGFKEFVKYKKRNKEKVKRMCPVFNAELLWNSARYIAERCVIQALKQPDSRKSAWSTVCIGSDYDGLINPINGFPNLKSFPSLRESLIQHATKFLNEPKGLLHFYSPLDAEELIDGLMYKHGMDFLKKNFKHSANAETNSNIASAKDTLILQ